MLVELRTRFQVTLPKDIVSSLGLAEGDKLEVYEKDGVICMVPVAVYPKEYVDDIHREIDQLKKSLRTGKQPEFEGIDSLISMLKED